MRGSTDVDVFTGTFEVLPDEECWELLRTQSVGRVAWPSDEGVQVLPVNYVLHDRQIVFRTAADRVLATLATGRQVAFQVDDIDVETQTGWTVLAQGASGSPVEQPTSDPDPWVNDRDLWVSIDLTQISGRLVEK